MRKTVAVAAVASLLSAILTACFVGQPKEVAHAQPAAKAQQWEYKLVTMDALMPVKIDNLDNAAREKMADAATGNYNRLAADGWEYAGTHHFCIVFKRPKR